MSHRATNKTISTYKRLCCWCWRGIVKQSSIERSLHIGLCPAQALPIFHYRRVCAYRPTYVTKQAFELNVAGDFVAYWTMNEKNIFGTLRSLKFPVEFLPNWDSEKRSQVENPSWESELRFRVEIPSWNSELKIRVKIPSWNSELKFRVKIPSWNSELRFRVEIPS